MLARDRDEVIRVELTAGHVWMVVAAGLVFFMTPGLALFYGGMTRAKGVLNMMMMSFAALGVVGVVWVLWGASMLSGDPVLGGLTANPFAHVGLQGLLGTEDLLASDFSVTFAIITVALISGAIADRTRFGTWVVFTLVWVTLVYFPLAYMVWGDGLFSEEGALGRIFGEPIDFAGGLAVHINAGIAALVLILLIGARRGFGRDSGQRPHNLPLVMLGSAILWFGWFGFNAGAATTVEQAALVWTNTLVAPAAAMLAWLLTERVRDGHATSLGAASGVVAGLVAITPACANVTPLGAIGLSAVAGVLSALAVGFKYRIGLDDSLDVCGVHLVSGIVGTVALGFLAIPSDGRAGLFHGGGWGLMGSQLAATVFVALYTGALTLLIGLVLKATMGLRITRRDEIIGVDLTQHAESAYSPKDEATGSFAGHGTHRPLPGTAEAPVPVKGSTS
ncbi:ammonium transporter [Bacillus sp. BGMRC0062]|nr:ammonium transporter [Bacillus sp. BGMRC0062]